MISITQLFFFGCNPKIVAIIVKKSLNVFKLYVIPNEVKINNCLLLKSDLWSIDSSKYAKDIYGYGIGPSGGQGEQTWTPFLVKDSCQTAGQNNSLKTGETRR